MDASDGRRLTDAFERHEHEALGEGVHDRYHQLVHELEQEFL